MSETLASELQTEHSLNDIVKKALRSVNTMDTVATAHFKLTGQDKEKVEVVEYTNNNYWAAKYL